MESCPRTGDQCSRCLDIAKTAFMAAYGQRHPGLSAVQVTTVTESSRVGALVEEQGGLEAINKCDERQARARKIGTALGAKVK